MGNLLLVTGSALWLGILTSISPCPLATNIAAISFLGRQVGRTDSVLMSGLLYTAGRMIAYLVLAALLVASLLSAPGLANFLQKYMYLFVGPLLILVGMVLLGLLELNLNATGMTDGVRRWISSLGIWGALPLGILFAVTFCPTSAALFFGSLVPLAMRAESTLLLPAVYGIGTAVPVLAFALVIVFSAQSVGKAFNVVAKIEWWARNATGVLFIVIGFYFAIRHIFGWLG